MKNKEILKKAIEKAKDNGFVVTNIHLEETSYGADYNEFRLIFSHDFAKAFWSKPSQLKVEYKKGKFVSGGTMNWKDHLQQMVLEEEPIKYLKKFL